MKNRNLIGLVILLLVALACEKEEIKKEAPGEGPTLNYSSGLKALEKSKSNSFEILNAGIWDEYLYLNLSYKVGSTGHKFVVNWDGSVIVNNGKKIVELNVYDLTEEDTSSIVVQDSLIMNLSELNLTPDLLNDSTLYYDVMNAGNPQNHFLIQAFFNNEGNDNGNDNNNNGSDSSGVKLDTLLVMHTDCDIPGIWDNFYLKYDDSKIYFPGEMCDSISYTPKANDILLVSYERETLNDSVMNDSIVLCDDLNTYVFEMIRIRELSKILK